MAEFFKRDELLSHLSANYPVTEKAITQYMTSAFTFQSSQTAVFHIPLSRNEASDEMKHALSSSDSGLASLVQPDMFVFYDYGCVVFWGVAKEHEARILKDLAPFFEEPWPEDDVDSETVRFMPGVSVAAVTTPGKPPY